MILLDEHVAALRDHAHRALEAVDHAHPLGRDGWARAEVEPMPHPCPWKWHHLTELHQAGLIDWREEWKDCWVKPTQAGLDLLSSLPTEAQP